MNKDAVKLNFEDLQRILASLETDWKARDESLQLILQSLPSLFLQRASLEKFLGLAQGLAVQFGELRSALVKLASEIIQQSASLSRKHKHFGLQKFSEEILKEQNFVKALGSANKVISRHSQAALAALAANNCLSFEALKNFSVNRSNKISATRERVAEAILLFMQGVMAPKSPTKNSLFSQNGQNEKPSSGENYSDDERNSFSKPQLKTQPKRIERPKTIDRTGGKFPQEVLRPIDFAPKQVQVQAENVDFFKEAAEFFIKDAAAPVREIAKEIKRRLPLFEASLANFIEGKDSNVSTETAEDFELRFQAPSKNQTIDTTQKDKRSGFGPQRKSSGQNSATKTLAFPQKIKDVSEKSGPKISKEPEISAADFLGVLENANINLAEKMDWAYNFAGSPENSIEITSYEFFGLLRIAELTKSPQLKESIFAFLLRADFENSKSQLFSQIIEKKLLLKPQNPNFLFEFCSRFGLKFLCQAFVEQKSEQTVLLVNTALSIDGLESLFKANPHLVERLIIRITENVKNSELQARILQENLALFERLMQNKEVIIFCSKFPFDSDFLEPLKKTNPSLHKFLSLKQKKSDSQSQQKLEQKPKASPEEFQSAENSKIQELMKKANSATRKNILKSIISHVVKLKEKEVSASTKQKIAAKTLDILKVTAEACERNDQETLECAFEVVGHLIAANIEAGQLESLYLVVLGFYQKHDAGCSDTLFALVSEFSIKQPAFLIFLISKAKGGGLFHLKVLGHLYELFRDSGNKEEAMKVAEQTAKEFVAVIRNVLIVHSDVQVRKTAVEVLVQLYRLLGQAESARLNKVFSPEQQALIAVYVKKSLL